MEKKEKKQNKTKKLEKVDLSFNNYSLIKDSVPSITYSYEKQLNMTVPFNACLCGTTGAGKTNWLLNIIKYLDCITKIKLFVKVPDEPLYAELVKKMQLVEKALKTNIIEVHSDIMELPEVDTFKTDRDNGEVTLIIFDDLINEKSKLLGKVGAYFTHGRKYNICSIFISQSYFKIPQIIRQNCQYLIFQKIKNKKDLTRIFSDNTFDIEPNALLDLYKISQLLQMAFMIDSKTQNENLRYRFNERSIKDLPEIIKEKKQAGLIDSSKIDKIEKIARNLVEESKNNIVI